MYEGCLSNDKANYNYNGALVSEGFLSNDKANYNYNDALVSKVVFQMTKLTTTIMML